MLITKYKFDMKICKKCGVEQSLDSFSEGRNQCKDCRNLNKKRNRQNNLINYRKSEKANRDKNKESINKAAKDNYWMNRESILSNQRKNYLIREYGITLEDKQIIYEEQNQCCQICKQKFEIEKLYVDHCHYSGFIRELLCRNCNSAFGLLNESVETLKNMIEYKQKHFVFKWINSTGEI